MIGRYSATITTTPDGAATVYVGHEFRGKVVAIKYAPGSLATGAGLVITGETYGVPILTKASAGTADVWYYPRAPANQVADGAAITNSQEHVWLYDERIKVVVAAGGDTKAGAITVYIDDDL